MAKTMNIATNISRLWQGIVSVIWPRCCSVCRRPLAATEPYVCEQCLSGLPLTLFAGRNFHIMDHLFAGKTLIDRSVALFYYQKRSPYTNIILDTKYRNMPQQGQWFGAYAARKIAPTNFFHGIDLIIPVPMHRNKRAKRGYNQAEYIAKGISEVTGLPIWHNIVAAKPHATQTHKSMYDRWLNAQGLFSAVNAEQLEGKHVLIVDDVVTTGATLISCAKTIENVPGIKISIMTLAASKLD